MEMRGKGEGGRGGISAKPSSTTQSNWIPGIALAASVRAGKVWMTSPSEEVLINSTRKLFDLDRLYRIGHQAIQRLQHRPPGHLPPALFLVRNPQARAKQGPHAKARPAISTFPARGWERRGAGWTLSAARGGCGAPPGCARPCRCGHYNCLRELAPRPVLQALDRLVADPIEPVEVE